MKVNKWGESTKYDKNNDLENVIVYIVHIYYLFSLYIWD